MHIEVVWGMEIGVGGLEGRGMEVAAMAMKPQTLLSYTYPLLLPLFYHYLYHPLSPGPK